MSKSISISLKNIVFSLSHAIDLVHKLSAYHQQRVTYTALQLAKKLGFSVRDQADLMYAAALHDMGVFSFEDRLKLMTGIEDRMDLGQHSQNGADLLQTFTMFAKAADIVRYHHHDWGRLNELEEVDKNTKVLANIVNLADKVDLLVRNQTGSIMLFNKWSGSWSKNIDINISQGSGKEFNSRIVDCFHDLSQKESFWFDLVSSQLSFILQDMIIWPDIILGTEEITQIGTLFSKIVDFRCTFTAAHSINVANVSALLAKQFARAEEHECQLMWIAGSLHDFGKVVIPNAIIEKPKKLNISEFDVIKMHPYFTYQVLNSVQGFEEISKWAGFHHERIDGMGYPFHLNKKTIPTGSKIMAVADTLSALIESRPYRPQLSTTDILAIIQKMAKTSALDPDIVATAVINFEGLKQNIEPLRSPFIPTEMT